MQHSMILIVDYGSQTTQLIARKIREMGVYSEVLPFDYPWEKGENKTVQGVILSGGPQSVAEEDVNPIPEVLLNLNVPILGICYGMQAMAVQSKGEVVQGESGEYGQTKLNLKPSPLWGAIPDSASETLTVWMSHHDQVKSLPPHFRVIASSEHAPIAAMAHEEKPWYAIQFHPEVTHTEQGNAILSQFVLGICDANASWQMDDIQVSMIEDIRAKVGTEPVILGLSGGVDSAVLAVLLHQAIGSQLTCVFVDTGLLRSNEALQVMETVQAHMKVKVIKIEAANRFFTALEGVVEPETKRKKVGELFANIFEEQAKCYSDDHTWLAQGTIYPDVIESGGVHGAAHVIKSHHNVGGLPKHLGMKVLEPLRRLFKDEVRQLGVQLGLPKAFIGRHPFPGPGLSLRVLGEVTPEKVETLQQCDQIFMDELHASGWYDKVAQAFALLLPVNSVGVVGDQRCYAPVVALRAVTSSDFMTAEWADLPSDLLARVSNRIVNEVSGVSRVVYDITHKPPATIEWE